MKKHTTRHLIETRPKANVLIRCCLAGLIVAAIGLCSMFVLRTQTTSAQGGTGRIISGNGSVMSVINVDPANLATYNLNGSVSGNTTEHPSVSSQTGRIAFMSTRGSEGLSGDRIYAMNADGSGVHQLTFQTGLAAPGSQEDQFPAISPDGTKIAFISDRFVDRNYPNGTPKGAEVWIVNFDGSGLRQVTASEQHPTSLTQVTFANAVAWGSNSSLIVSGKRIVIEPDTTKVPKLGIFSFSDSGSGQDLKVQTPNFAPAMLDAIGNNFVYAELTVNSVVQCIRVNTDPCALGPTPTGNVINLEGGLRFSPDGSKLLYGSNDENGSIRTISLNGTSRTTIRNNVGITRSKWWLAGPAIPTPARLELTPDTIVIQPNSPAQIQPTLYDSNNNVIFRAAQYGVVCDATHPCTIQQSGTIAPVFQDGPVRVRPGFESNQGVLTLCGSNGGVTGCNLVAVGLNLAEVRASVPTAKTSGTDGPGVFTIRRLAQPTQLNTLVSIDFTVGGTGVRNLDYALDVTGNQVIMAAGQTTLDIKVTPLRSNGNKTVVLNIAAPAGGTYVTAPGRNAATVNITDDGASASALSLSSVTPTSGGDDGVVLATVQGKNIKPGATVKLTRTGQNDIVGASIKVWGGGTFVDAALDLTGKVQGQWNVVVTNPDNTTATLSNAFSIATTSPARIWMNILGSEAIRASHRDTQYSIFYGNSGNVDAYGVMMFISITIPQGFDCELDSTGACTRIVTEVLPLIDFPGEPPFPQEAHDLPNVLSESVGGTRREIIPLFFPRVRASGTGVFKIKLKFHSISGAPALGISAAAMPPMLKAVSLGNSSNPLVFAPAANQDNPGLKCATAIMDSLLNCAGLIPGLSCGAQVMSSLAGNINSMINFGSSSSPSGADHNAFGAGLMGGMISRVAGCLGSLVPITKIYTAFTCLNSIVGAGFSCLDAHDSLDVTGVNSVDPNEKIGARGLTISNFLSGEEPLRYVINFENLPTASAPAQTVVVTDQLDTTTLDLTTFALTQITFGDTVITVPAGLKSYATDVDLRPANNLIVHISSQLNTNTGLMTWQFDSIDPFTRQPTTDPLAGFLPPNVLGTEGAGSVSFTISPKSNLASGTEIRNRARIVFDLNVPIDTNEWLNTIDNSKPTSSVQTLAPQQPFIVFDVNWSGSDTGSGVRDYTLYVSENGGPYQAHIVYTTQTSTLFAGKPNTNYAFYVIARDQTGNTENIKTSSEATTHTSAAVQNAIDDPRFFVRQHYLDFLSRSPDGSGLNFWTNEITLCGNSVDCISAKRVNVSAAFYLSIEFQQTDYLVYRLYKAAFGNVPNTPVPIRFGELLPDAQKIGKGVVVNQTGWEQLLENNKQAFVTELVNRTRFTDAYPATLTAAQFVDQLNVNAGNALSQAERDQLISALASNTKTRAQVLRAVAEDTDLFNAEFNRAFVLIQYFGYLRRDPDSAPDTDFSGYNFWLNKLNSFNGNFVNADMVKAFIVSGEYRHRFGQ